MQKCVSTWDTGYLLLMGENEGGEPYTKTPFLNRLPMLGALALAFILAMVFGHALWSGLLIFLLALVACVLILRFVFGQPLDRLLSNREFKDE